MKNYLLLLLFLFTGCSLNAQREYYWLDQEDTNMVHLLSSDYIQERKDLYDQRREDYYWLSARDLHRFESLPVEYISNSKIVYDSIRDDAQRRLKAQTDQFVFDQCYRSNDFMGCLDSYN